MAANEETTSTSSNIILTSTDESQANRNVLAQSAASTSADCNQMASDQGIHVDATAASLAKERAALAPPHQMSSSREQNSKAEVTWPNPITPARLKWCGCLASSPCSHFTNYHQYYNPTSTQQWMPLPPTTSFTFPHATQQPGVRLNPMQHYMSSQVDLRQLAKLKAQILAHPMYDQLLAAHVACLRVATPVDHLPTIDAQLSTNVQHVATKYSTFLGGDQQLQSLEEKEELDRFMANYIVLLHSFKEQLHEHVRIQAMDAVVSCWEIEKAFISLSGISPGEGSGATMSDEEEDRMSTFMDPNSSIDFLEGLDSLGLGPLLPSESERSLMERVRLELKSELKQGYKNRIADVREEILRKRRAGKLPTETTAILKKWWNTHSKWPYPTEDEKARLVQETGLELKQINNWFINQRKRNWHSHASTTSTSVPKNETSISATAGAQSSNISLSLNCETDKVSNRCT